MKQIQTISQLNMKPWYRLLKVIYIVFFLIIIIISVAIIFSNNKPKFSNEKSSIHCDNGSDYSLAVNNIYLYGEYIGYADDLTFRKWCNNNIDQNFNAKKNYNLIAVYNERNWDNIFYHSLITIVIILLLADAIRRIFYYVVLGKLFPPVKDMKPMSETTVQKQIDKESVNIQNTFCTNCGYKTNNKHNFCQNCGKNIK